MSLKPEDLIKAWQTSSSCAEVCKKLNGADDGHVRYLVGRLKKFGVPLKQFTRRTKFQPHEIEAFKKLARTYSAGAP